VNSIPGASWDFQAGRIKSARGVSSDADGRPAVVADSTALLWPRRARLVRMHVHQVGGQNRACLDDTPKPPANAGVRRANAAGWRAPAAREYQPAISSSSVPFRVEKCSLKGKNRYRVVGIAWGGSRPGRGCRYVPIPRGPTARWRFPPITKMTHGGFGRALVTPSAWTLLDPSGGAGRLACSSPAAGRRILCSHSGNIGSLNGGMREYVAAMKQRNIIVMVSGCLRRFDNRFFACAAAVAVARRRPVMRQMRTRPVPQEILDRPVPLRMDIGSLHEK